MAIFELVESKLKNGIALSLPIQILLIQWAAAHPGWIEKYYSQGVYPYISVFFRYLYGWVPFSVGDLLYACLGLLALGYLIRKRQKIRAKPLAFLRDLTMVLAILHFTFYSLWGLNYFRMPLAQQLELEEAYSEQQLIRLTEFLLKEANRQQLQLAGDSLQAVSFTYTKPESFEKTRQGYELLTADYPEFEYSPASLKKSIFSSLLSYMGYGGYLNPFTGEAQVNGLLPLFRFPVVCGHEVAHQLGYSAENETNFIGWLVSSRNKDPYIQYASTAYALSYCLSSLDQQNSEARKLLSERMNPGLKRNFEELRRFWEQYKNPLEPVFKTIFNSYLQANGQKDGIKSYSRVVSLLIAYHNKEGLIPALVD
ncbi:DUF3810 domain-containing protein [Robiginitalea sp. IMCC43444]|uniref:DUF3810 domain-containing protein n=1 Tax=Robiginitalea sp. IMCC43444 TaxID=3459121 RepID=UPI0040433DB0